MQGKFAALAKFAMTPAEFRQYQAAGGFINPQSFLHAAQQVAAVPYPTRSSGGGSAGAPPQAVGQETRNQRAPLPKITAAPTTPVRGAPAPAPRPPMQNAMGHAPQPPLRFGKQR